MSAYRNQEVNFALLLSFVVGGFGLVTKFRQ